MAMLSVVNARRANEEKGVVGEVGGKEGERRARATAAAAHKAKALAM